MIKNEKIKQFTFTNGAAVKKPLVSDVFSTYSHVS